MQVFRGKIPIETIPEVIADQTNAVKGYDFQLWFGQW